MNQQGSGAILGICALSVVMWMGIILFDLTKTENEISAGFLEGAIAQNLAEAGARYAIEQLKLDKEFTGAENSVMIEDKEVVHYKRAGIRKKIYRVYVTGVLADRIILSVGEAGRVKRQVVVHVKLPDKDNSFSVVRWNNE